MFTRESILDVYQRKQECCLYVDIQRLENGQPPVTYSNQECRDIMDGVSEGRCGDRVETFSPEHGGGPPGRLIGVAPLTTLMLGLSSVLLANRRRAFY